MSKKIRIIIAAVILLAGFAFVFEAKIHAIPVTATLSEVSGDVQVMTPGASWKAAKEGMALPAGTAIKTGSKSSAVVKWSSANFVKLTPFTNFTIKNIDIDPRTKKVTSDLDMFSGKVKFRAEKLANPDSEFKVTTPTAVAGVRGTTGDIANSSDNTTEVLGRSGLICVTSNGQEVCVKENEMTTVDPGKPPTPSKKVTKQEMDKCTEDADCISGKCDAGQCSAEGSSFDTSACYTDGARCSTNRNCCSGSCASGVCESKKESDSKGVAKREEGPSGPEGQTAICEISSPADGQRVPLSLSNVSVTGRAIPNATCNVNGTETKAGADGKFNMQIGVSAEGDLGINVSCSNVNGKGSSSCGSTVKVVGPPKLTIMSPSNGFKDCPDINIVGTVDPGASLTLNDVNVLGLSNAEITSEGFFQIQNYKLPDCVKPLQFTAQDQFNQRTFVVVEHSAPVCGDGIINGTDKCDSGEANTDTACEASYGGTCSYCDKSCVPHIVTGPSCGDGTLNGTEICDSGNANTNTACVAPYQGSCNYCDTSCVSHTVTGPVCGDGVVNGTEICDAGGENSTTPCVAAYGGTCSYCDASCNPQTIVGGVCGDGTVNGAEVCDTGVSNTDTACVAAYGQTCSYCDMKCASHSVTGPACGDGTINGEEICDSGASNTNTPCEAAYGSTCSYCDTACASHSVTGPACGDGTINGEEICDSGASNTNTPCE
ncbi:MAG: FecR family protein, partial [bacterium]